MAKELIRLVDCTMAFDGETVLDSINLYINNKEFLTLLGPSGCGKTTTLRMIAGLEEITSGDLFIDGKRMNDVAPKDRDIAMVFQNYALYPHMTVYENMAFGLKLRKVPKDEIDRKVKEAAKILDLSHLLDRKPKALSGGQRQRLGIARALALEPKIIVCDEATSALDVSVQEKICELLCRIQKEKNITYLFIAHDLGLVDLMCHQVAVMYLGNVVEWMEHGRIAEHCKHPYTKALMGAVFKVDFKPGEKIEPLEGEIPSPLDLPPGCPFASRCEHCTEHCVQVKPELKEVEHGHWVACHLFD